MEFVGWAPVVSGGSVRGANARSMPAAVEETGVKCWWTRADPDTRCQAAIGRLAQIVGVASEELATGVHSVDVASALSGR